MSLTRLIYVSQPTENFTPTSLEAILQVARVRNSEKGLTGMLCFNNKYFLQCLEGSRNNVNALYEKILLDDRHFNAVILDYSEINVRDFNDWSMGYIPTSSLTAPLNLTFSNSQDFMPYEMSGRSVYMMLLALRDSLQSV